MDAEFKAIVEMWAPECHKKRRHNVFSEITSIVAAGWEVFTDAINDLGAFRCDFNPFHRLRAVYRKCEVRQAIGFHGLL